ncbi:DUF2827 domain-containing protein, partial [Francisellaceae bacterium]|nr:DUF2827 domain-containing protein [Francisellaceae bacterium]
DNLAGKVNKANPKCKIALLILGSLYHHDMSSMIGNKPGGLLGKRKWLDEVWISPHLEPDLAYHETVFYPTKVKISPFIWTEKFLKSSIREHKKHRFVVDNLNVRDQKVIIMEPNITPQKFFLMPMTLCENAYNRFGLPKSVSVMCADHLNANDSVMTRVRDFNMFEAKDINIYFNARVQLIQGLHECGNILVAHQYSCELNYLYLECLSLGLPVVHNSPMLKEVGYYYPGNDIHIGAEKLKEAIESHDENQLEYSNQAKKFIKQFSIKNKDNVSGYRKLIGDLIGAEKLLEVV